MTSVSSDPTSDSAWQAVNAAELMYETGWTDGLPVIPPTKTRVMEFVNYLKRSPEELIGEIPPLGG